MWRCTSTLIAASSCALALAAPVAAQVPVPQGNDFQVNTYTTSYQGTPQIAMDADGDFVVVWRSDRGSGTDPSNASIQGQRFASDGTAQGAQFQVNTYTTGSQYRPAVATAADGSFVVVWDSNGDGSLRGIRGRRYDASGSPLGADFGINALTLFDQTSPSVAMAADGRFVVAWSSNFTSAGPDTSSLSVQAQRFAANGSPDGGQFQVNTYGTNSQDNASVAIDAAGNFVVTWDSIGAPEQDPVETTDTSFNCILAQRFAADGSPQGPEFQVNTNTFFIQEKPSVSMAANGNFMIAWDNQDEFHAKAQRYGATGIRFGEELLLHTFTDPQATFGDSGPAVAAGPDGEYFVAWSGQPSPSTDSDNRSIQLQLYNVAGQTLETHYQVNTFTTGSQSAPAIAVDATGKRFVIAWMGTASGGTDTSSFSVHARRFGVTPVPVVSAPLAGALALGVALSARRWLRAPSPSADTPASGRR